MSNSVPAGQIVDGLDIRVSADHGLPTGGILILRTIYPDNQVGLVVGTSNTQSWIDNVGLVRAAEIIMQNDMLISSISSLRDDDEEED